MPDWLGPNELNKLFPDKEKYPVMRVLALCLSPTPDDISQNTRYINDALYIVWMMLKCTAHSQTQSHSFKHKCQLAWS